MLDFDEFLGDLFDAGSSKKGWRSWWAILGLLIGAAIGCWIGYQSSGLLGALSGLAIGGLIGWFVSVLLTGVLRILVLFVIFFVAIAGFHWLTGGP